MNSSSNHSFFKLKSSVKMEAILHCLKFSKKRSSPFQKHFFLLVQLKIDNVGWKFHFNVCSAPIFRNLSEGEFIDGLNGECSSTVTEISKIIPPLTFNCVTSGSNLYDNEYWNGMLIWYNWSKRAFSQFVSYFEEHFHKFFSY